MLVLHFSKFQIKYFTKPGTYAAKQRRSRIQDGDCQHFRFREAEDDQVHADGQVQTAVESAQAAVHAEAADRGRRL